LLHTNSIFRQKDENSLYFIIQIKITPEKRKRIETKKKPTWSEEIRKGGVKSKKPKIRKKKKKATQNSQEYRHLSNKCNKRMKTNEK
jgi:hypothetical protein